MGIVKSFQSLDFMRFHYVAYTFKAPLQMAGIKTKLDALGRVQWFMRDSDTWGDYLSARIPEDSWLKLYELGPGAYQLDVKFRPANAEEGKAWPELEAWVKDKLLVTLGATDIAQAEIED